MNLKELQIKLRSLVNDVVDKPLLDVIGEEVSNTVKDRTRKGFGVSDNNAPKKRLKGISESTKKRRKRLAAKGNLSSETSPNRSNLTRSGEMLNNITHKVSDNEVTVFLKGDNNKKAKQVTKGGRPFMNLSKTENRKVLKIVEEAIKKGINKKGL